MLMLYGRMKWLCTLFGINRSFEVALNVSKVGVNPAAMTWWKCNVYLRPADLAHSWFSVVLRFEIRYKGEWFWSIQQTEVYLDGCSFIFDCVSLHLIPLILSLVSDCLTMKSFRGQNRVDVVAREALFIEQIIKEFFKTNSSFDAPGSDIRLNLQTYNVILSYTKKLIWLKMHDI